MAKSVAELYGRAQGIHSALKADDLFTHANEESRRIIVPDLSGRVSALAESLLSPDNFVPFEVVRRCATIVAAASKDLGASYIRTKGGVGGVDIDFRGDTGPVDFDRLNPAELFAIETRRSGVDVIVTPDRVMLDVHTAFMSTPDDRQFRDIVDPLIRTLSSDQVAIIADGLLAIAEEAVLRVTNS